jgi:hypothetical protein
MPADFPFEVDSASKERIWKIRDFIQNLEDVKDEIIKFWNAQEKKDASTGTVWGDDVKELYYNIVAAWEMLDGAVKGELNYFKTSKGFLEGAKSRWAQCASELRAIDEPAAQTLNEALEKAFNQCYNAIYAEVKNFAPKQKFEKPKTKIYKISDKEYRLPCSICGTIAVIFKIEVDRWSNEEALIYTGITHQTGLGLNLADPVFKLLETGQIAEVHQLLGNYVATEQGIDAYCPDCDKIYCWEHYSPVEEFDDGFYDDTMGTCPEGHTRMIDD